MCLLSGWTLDIHTEYLQNWFNDIKIFQSHCWTIPNYFYIYFLEHKIMSVSLKNIHMFQVCRKTSYTIPVIIYNSYGMFSFAELTQQS